MIRYERQQALLALLKEKNIMTVHEISKLLYISEASVRRDIEELERQSSVKRIYGGVMLAAARNSVIPLNLRDNINSSAKEEIAQKAASIISDGDTVLMDGSSTVRRILKYIGDKKNIKIITNNLRIFEEYADSGVTLYCTGGTYLTENRIFIGSSAENYLRSVHANLLFFSSQGISENGEISDASEAETSLRKVMLERADKAYFLCDDSKYGVKKTFTLCHKSAVTDVICNTPLSWTD